MISDRSRLSLVTTEAQAADESASHGAKADDQVESSVDDEAASPAPGEPGSGWMQPAALTLFAAAAAIAAVGVLVVRHLTSRRIRVVSR